jgi:hypothetical protein
MNALFQQGAMNSELRIIFRTIFCLPTQTIKKCPILQGYIRSQKSEARGQQAAVRRRERYEVRGFN